MSTGEVDGRAGAHPGASIIDLSLSGVPVSRKAAHSLMRGVNRALVVELLRDAGPLSRVEVARRTRLSKPTVSAIVEDLLRDGLVAEIGPAPAQPHGGRPAELLTYNLRADAFAGVQFGATRTHVAVADGLGRVIGERSAPATGRDAPVAVAAAAALIRAVAAECRVPTDRLRAVGVAVPGLVRRETGVCAIAPNLGWREEPIGALVGDATGVPALVLNSSAAAACAEARRGRAIGRHNFVWVYAGTGIGAGLVVDGQPYGGEVGFAGEIGHCPVVDGGPVCTCGNRGCLEAVAGAAAVGRAGAAAVAAGTMAPGPGGRGPDARAVAAAAAAGDPTAVGILSAAGRHLGRGVAYLMNIVNPGLVVVGGPLAGAGPVYLDAVRESVADHAMTAERVDVVATTLGEHAPRDGVVDLVAAWWLREQATAMA